MAEKAKQKLDSSPETSCESKGKLVKIVHIGNPRMVTASASEFSAVVQSLTGNKRPLPKSATYDSSSSSTSKRLNKDGYNSEVKIPKFEGQSKYRSFPSSSPQLPIANQIAAIRADGVSTSEVQQKEMISYVYNHERFDTLENLGDANFLQFLLSYFNDEGI
ncbi:uncharacterized protein LOC131862568 [Cryptomeria japonica]|uniref:uncharacterized protein LOC131862568 n=1 Tax=Cryptomeria japonica TaxID=3369 RepID=UPI0025ABC324|nr:uncharacterized protein LOC131862568 [Cryptomeria japonica]